MHDVAIRHASSDSLWQRCIFCFVVVKGACASPAKVLLHTWQICQSTNEYSSYSDRPRGATTGSRMFQNDYINIT